jgi:Zn-dependent protease
LLEHLNFAQIFIGFLVLLFSLTVHESAHAWVAARLGDPTGRLMGRVSLNPAAHVDPVGTVLFPLLAMVTRLPLIGWAKPVPVDFRNLKNPRRDFMLIAAAGPAANLLLAIVAAIGMRLTPNEIGAINGSGSLEVLDTIRRLHQMGFWVAIVTLSMLLELNLLLAVFNMLPVPPLDGGNVLAGLLPDRIAAVFDSLRPYGFVILYALIFTGVLVRIVRVSTYLEFQLLTWTL